MRYEVYRFDSDGQRGVLVSQHRKYGPAERSAIKSALLGHLTDLRDGHHVIATFHPEWVKKYGTGKASG